MAKKAKEESDEIVDSSETLLKQYGSLIKSGKYVTDGNKKILSISPALDIALGGGVPEGSVCIFTGKPKFGKTTACLQFAKNAQDDGRVVYYFNIEGRLKKRDLEGIVGLKAYEPYFYVIGSEKGNILSAQKYLEIAEATINLVPRSVVILDSASALCTEEEKTAEIDKMQRADGPKLLAKFFRRVCNVTPINDVILIATTQMMGNPTGYGAALQDKGGYAIGHHHDIKIWVKGKTPWTANGADDGEQIGQKNEWDVLTSAIGGPGKAVSFHRYGEGIDKYMEIAQMGIDFGVIKGNKPWYTLPTSAGDKKFQGTFNVRNALKEDEDLYKKIEREIRTLLGVKE